MFWKKLLLELGALSGFGGGIGGWFSRSGGGVQIKEDSNPLLFRNNSLKVKQAANKEIKKKSGLVKELDYTTLGIYRWQSEGVSEDILFVKGWNGAGSHQTISSSKHSQANRELWGGKKIAIGGSWFGPRKTTLELESLETAQKEVKGNKKNYWTEIQRSGKFITQEDLVELQKFWSERDRGLEEDIFGLYHGWDWWADKFGTTRNGKKVDLEFDLSKIKTMLNKTEEELRGNKWDYGQLFKNPKLERVRWVGDVEDTAFNYLKKYIWPTDNKVKSLAEKNILIAIFALMTGSPDTGFDCSGGDSTRQQKHFKECNQKRSGWKVKKVLKTTLARNTGWLSSSYTYNVPEANKGTQWDGQPELTSADKQQLLKMDDIANTGLLDEKCEEKGWFGSFNGSLQIRQEVCDQIIRPWFGDWVSDKRLCLMEVEDHTYHLRLQTYLEVLQVPTWMNRNTFWTKCSNYNI